MNILIVVEGSNQYSYLLAPVAHEFLRHGDCVSVVTCTRGELNLPGWDGPVTRIRGFVQRRGFSIDGMYILFRALSQLKRIAKNEKIDAVLFLDCMQVSILSYFISRKYPTLLHVADTVFETHFSKILLGDNPLSLACAFKSALNRFPNKRTFHVGFPIQKGFRGSPSPSVPAHSSPLHPIKLLFIGRKGFSSETVTALAKTLALLKKKGFFVSLFHVIPTTWDPNEIRLFYQVENVTDVSLQKDRLSPERYSSLFSQAHACICQAGAGEIFDCVAARLPMLLIPDESGSFPPYQFANAEELIYANCAIGLAQSQLTTEEIASSLATLFDPKRHRSMKKSLEAYAVPNPPARLREALQTLVNEAKPTHA